MPDIKRTWIAPLPRLRDVGDIPGPAELDAAILASPCCRDATSIFGLKPLKRRFPQAWHFILSVGQPRIPLTQELTLGEWLVAGAGGLLHAEEPDYSGLERKRTAASRARSTFGGVLISGIDEARLERMRVEYVWRYKQTLVSEVVGADLTLLRQAIRAGQLALGLEPVEESWSVPRGASTPRAARPTPHPFDVAAFMLLLGMMLRAVVALIVGAGLLDSEIRRLLVSSLDLTPGSEQVVVCHPKTRGHPKAKAYRVIPLPPWAVVELQGAFPDLHEREPNELLFHADRRPSRPHAPFRQELLAVAELHGLCARGDPENPYLSTSLRRLYQAVAAANGLPRSLIRGTACQARTPEGEDARRSWEMLLARRMARLWVLLIYPPGELDPGIVPRRAPKGVQAYMPERTRK
ncbi:MAG: hypothetical protein ABIO70_07990 [Pseudomonadota bacterium]